MQCYEGKENYIFISYAHKDSDKVLPVIKALNDASFRVWYDAGIEAGSEWPENVAEHLCGSAVTLIFLSPFVRVAPLPSLSISTEALVCINQ